MKKSISCLMLAYCLSGILQTNAQNLIVEYEFDGTLSDRLNNSTLTAFGPANDGNNRNNLESGFLEDANGTYWYWLSSLARGGGFWIDVDQDISESYTVGLRFSFNQTNPGYRKIIDYQNSTSDNGFYFLGKKLNFYPEGTGTAEIENHQLVDLIATRESNGTFKAYFVVDGELITPPELNVNAGTSGKPTLVGGKPRFGFFFDDTQTTSEATNGGKVYGIKIWDSALSEAQIQDALNPKAVVANVNITGVTESAITPKDVEISLLQGETISSAIAQNTDLSSWITNLPAGLSAKAKDHIPADATSFILEVYGTPTEAYSAPIRITIPGSALSNGVNILVATNPNAKFGIGPYTVIYDGNSQTSGTPPSDPITYPGGSSVTVLSNTGNLAKTGYHFYGWNTAPDGSGAQYAVGETFTMGDGNVLLYARWTLFPPLQAGTASANQTICYNQTPALLSATAPTGCTGTYSYLWQSKVGTGLWENISGATALTFQPGTLTQTTSYRLAQTDESCDPGQTVFTNEITVTVQRLQQFRSKQSGNWTEASNWEQFTGVGDDWITATEYPSEIPNSCLDNPLVTIRTGHEMEIPTTEEIDIPNLKIETDAKLTIKSGGQIIIQEKLELDEQVGAAIIVE